MKKAIERIEALIKKTQDGLDALNDMRGTPGGNDSDIGFYEGILLAYNHALKILEEESDAE